MVHKNATSLLTTSQLKSGIVICHEKHKNHPFGVFYGQNPLDYSFPLTLLEISMVIIFTRIIHFILKPFGQPRVVSEILGGMMVGPSFLGRSKRFSKYLFPDNANFVVRSIGILGFTYFLFLSGIKTDVAIIKKANKKQWCVALIGVAVPCIVSISIALAMRSSLSSELAKPSSIWGVSACLAITSFPVLAPIIKEFNLLSSELGRTAMTTTILSDLIGISGLIAFEAAKQEEGKNMAALWYMITLVVFVAAIVGGFRQVMILINRSTPEGKPVEQAFVVSILLGVLVAAFLADMGGLAILNGALWLGLAIPDGPPLAATLVEKIETIVVEILMPFSFTFVGLSVDVYSMNSRTWPILKPLFFMSMAAYIAKFIATFAAASFFRTPRREGLALSLIMSLRGQVDLLLFLHWGDFKMMTLPSFSMMVVLAVGVTAVFAPWITILYDPRKPYMISKRRDIQHNPPNTELQIVACIHDQESLAGIINLLEVSNPSLTSPFNVCALRLVELVGRATSYFIDHDKQDEKEEITEDVNYKAIVNALNRFQQARTDMVKIHVFTSITLKGSMYQDICELALVSKASLILLPFQKELFGNLGGAEVVVGRGIKTVNSYVLDHAPCSVGVLVDKGPFRKQFVDGSGSGNPSHHLAVLFMGGADCRESLVYADRMAANPDVTLTVIRFLAQNNEGENLMEKKLDDGLVTWFWVKNEGNNRVDYKEVVVSNGEETIAAIQAMNCEYFDLWIVGRKHGINPVLLQGLSSWSENLELGVIGDYVASMDLSSKASVLVIQQQILRSQEAPALGFMDLHRRWPFK